MSEDFKTVLYITICISLSVIIGLLAAIIYLLKQLIGAQ